MHAHTSASNPRFRDSKNGLLELLKEAKAKDQAGINITDHGVLTAHPKVCMLRDAHPEFFKDFRVTFGSEIYLVDRDQIEYARKHNVRTKFYHFVVTARNMRGYHALRIISSDSWANSFWFRGMRRLPTYKDDLAELMKDFKGDVIASTACLGSELSQDIIHKDRTDTVKFLNYLVDTFGKDCVAFEMMPSKYRDQLTVNQGLKRLSDTTGIPYVISTDSHYIDKRDRSVHANFLRAENFNRNIDDYYRYACLFSPHDLKDYFNPDVMRKAFLNSRKILDRIETIDLHRPPEVTKVPIPDFKPVNLAKYNIDWHKYPYIVDYVTSDYREDCYYIAKLFEGMRTRHLPFNHTYLHRIDHELHVLKAILDHGSVTVPMSNYFLTMRKMMDICWTISIVGPGRGSCGCFLVNYLLYLNDVDPIRFHLDSWRFLSIARVVKNGDFPDIDFDTESSQRLPIIGLFKDYFGKDKVLNFSTLTTLGAKGAIKSACRGYLYHGNRISYLKGANLTDLLPKENHDDWTIHDAFFGNKKKDRKPVKRFIQAVNQYPGLAKDILGSVGKVTGISQHASGVYISNSPITEHNAMMLTSKGLPVTQYPAKSSAYCGALKFDTLTIKNLDIIHEAIRLLLRDHLIKWQGTFRKTYSHYFAASNMNMNDPKVFDKINTGKILDLFEFSTLVGRSILQRLKPRTFDQLIACNSLMRLTVDSGEQPKDRYARYRANIKEWYRDMYDAGLSKAEMDIMKKHLSRYYGVCYGQETLMKLAMDPKITNFTQPEANTLRKSIAKKDHKLYAREQKKFYAKGEKCGTSEALLDYVWKYCADPAKNYSFNLAHGTAYTIICMVDAVIATYYPTYWDTACLSVNSGIYGHKFENPDYTKLDRALGSVRDLVTYPDINKSSYKFIPDGGKILFGLYPISGIGIDDVKTIINHRPYRSFDDFVKKTNLSKRKNIQLIKSGAFNRFGNQPRALMIHYVNQIVPDKKRLTTVQIPKIERYIPKKFEKMVKLYRFRRLVTGRYKVPMNDHLKDKFFGLYEPLIRPDYGKSYSFSDGKLKINIKIFNKWYNKFIQPLKDWLKTDTAIKCESRLRKRHLWIKYCLGNPESWEMDSLGDYVSTHELKLTNVGELYHVTNLAKLPKNPKIVDWRGYSNHKFPIFEHHFIYGTVVGKNSTKALVFLLTPDGVANVRIGKNRYVRYNKKITVKRNKKSILIKDSWFNRGTKLLCLGFKRGNNFFLNRQQTGYNHCLYRIKGYGANAKVVSY